MSKAASIARRSSKGHARGKSKGAYVWDRLIAVVAMLMDLLALAFGGLLVGYGFFDPSLLKGHELKWTGGIGALLLAVAVGHLVVHAGLFASRRWAFVVAALLAGYGLSAASAWASGFMLLYTVLRLGRVFGPDLR